MFCVDAQDTEVQQDSYGGLSNLFDGSSDMSTRCMQWALEDGILFRVSEILDPASQSEDRGALSGDSHIARLAQLCAPDLPPSAFPFSRAADSAPVYSSLDRASPPAAAAAAFLDDGPGALGLFPPRGPEFHYSESDESSSMMTISPRYSGGADFGFSAPEDTGFFFSGGGGGAVKGLSGSAKPPPISLSLVPPLQLSPALLGPGGVDGRLGSGRSADGSADAMVVVSDDLSPSGSAAAAVMMSSSGGLGGRAGSFLHKSVSSDGITQSDVFSGLLHSRAQGIYKPLPPPNC
jgi:hypothetical protein